MLRSWRGFPAGLAGEGIAIEARLMAIANAIDAALAPMPGPADVDALHTALRAKSGAVLDPELTALALAHLEPLLAVRARARGRDA